MVSRPRASAPAVRQTALVLAPAAASSGFRAPQKRVILPLVGFAATFAFVSASLVNPLSGAYASTTTPSTDTAISSGYTVGGQSYTVADGASISTSRDAYTVNYTAPVVVEKAKTTATAESTATDTATADTTAADAAPTTTTTTVTAAPAAAAATPGSAQAIGAQLVAARGWDTSQYNCLVSLWNKESGWNVYAANPSGAYGIPQALPGSKMASVGADWQTSASTQITWGLNYIQGRYGNPCGAWAHSVANNWY
ncbi:hypothetical protein EDF46_0774 [Frondihabitans sp. PhB188]|uniref:aggregation-promoting factor C-terminal-like domain-containing protein n=1 Tax=Frondihabitans sp. PhB188 TaxID=2485200 RepID=UPI000FA4F900|nr:lytic transglycosylase domain-containing protein [Frondihabitans sp. PhB188]ROQ41396.1 hypothetical protein EDF46_0774 [Frondihabitans sp. PhB188]